MEGSVETDEMEREEKRQGVRENRQRSQELEVCNHDNDPAADYADETDGIDGIDEMLVGVHEGN